jgi:hypothetical protein
MRKLDAAQARRHVPFLFCFVGNGEHAIQRLPGLAGVFAAKKADRADAHVHDSLVARIDGERAHVAVHDFRPGFAAVFAAIAAVESHRCEHDLRPVLATDQVLEGFALEELADRGQRSAMILHDFESAVMSDVVT